MTGGRATSAPGTRDVLYEPACSYAHVSRRYESCRRLHDLPFAHHQSRERRVVTAAGRVGELVEQLGDGWSVRVGVGSGNRVVVAELGERRLFASAASELEVRSLVDRSRPRLRLQARTQRVPEGSETR